jgi:hypothetical protein
MSDCPERAGDIPCEFLFLLRAGFERAVEVSASGLAGGIAALGDGYGGVSALGGRARFGPRRHDGAMVASAVGYNQDRDAFVYTSPPRPLE